MYESSSDERSKKENKTCSAVCQNLNNNVTEFAPTPIFNMDLGKVSVSLYNIMWRLAGYFGPSANLIGSC